jgi:hypothetical protein
MLSIKERKTLMMADPRAAAAAHQRSLRKRLAQLKGALPPSQLVVRRWHFCLSSNEDYKVACKMLKRSLSFQDIDGLPDWASWSSGDRHLPDSLFEEEDLELAITDIGAVASSVDHMEATLVLALGLVLRALNTT